MNDYVNVCREAICKDEEKIALPSMRDLILDIVGASIEMSHHVQAINENMFGDGTNFEAKVNCEILGTESFESLLYNARSILSDSVNCAMHIRDKIGG